MNSYIIFVPIFVSDKIKDLTNTEFVLKVHRKSEIHKQAFLKQVLSPKLKLRNYLRENRADECLFFFL